MLPQKLRGYPVTEMFQAPDENMVAGDLENRWNLLLAIKNNLDDQVSLRLTAHHPSLDRYTDKYPLCGPHRCAGSVPHRNPWREIYRSRSSQKPVSGQLPNGRPTGNEN